MDNKKRATALQRHDPAVKPTDNSVKHFWRVCKHFFVACQCVFLAGMGILFLGAWCEGSRRMFESLFLCACCFFLSWALARWMKDGEDGRF